MSVTIRTGKGLAAHARMALAENWGYCLGGFGQKLTPAVLAQKLAQGGGVGAYNSRHRAYLEGFLGRRVTDCYGLVKSYLWWRDGDVTYGTASCPDRNQESAFQAARVKGPLTTLPEVPGLVLWMEGHAGIYLGGGDFIECAGAPAGMRAGKIQQGKVAAGSRFTHWFADTYITYGTTEEDTAPPPGPRYQTLGEVPAWARPAVEALLARGALSGEGGGLGLTPEMLRVFAVLYRLGLYDNKTRD